jgi:UDP-hydrolysing UDP-N-acetyl-D-glucosamine 2-epimerase
MSTLKKICVITAARSEYGLLKWLMHEIKNDSNLTLQIIVTGSHLSPNFGYTYKEIEEDGFFIDEKINMLLTGTTSLKIAKSMGHCMIGMATTFHKLRPDIIVIMGDRYELLSIAGVALVMNIPIAHISGGDITEGAIDDQVRHAVSKMANIHFPGNQESAQRLIQMGERPENVFNVGELGLDSVHKSIPINRKNLSAQLGLNPDKKWILCTYHPETKIGLEENIRAIDELMKALRHKKDYQILITKSNADAGGKKLNEILTTETAKNPDMFRFIDSLGQLRYISMLKNVAFLIGNSSSAVFEAPVIPIYAINIGNRQLGRFMPKNIISCNADETEINMSIRYIENLPSTFLDDLTHPYGNGTASTQIKSILKNIDKSQLIKKGFYSS